jgi:hypothetical protein
LALGGGQEQGWQIQRRILFCRKDDRRILPAIVFVAYAEA